MRIASDRALSEGRGGAAEMTMMRAAVLHGKEDVRVEQVPVPELQKGDLLVRVGAALTCGTDVKVFRRGYHAKMIQPPAVFGHEFAGTVEVGNDRFNNGARVTAANSAPCGFCFYCVRKQPNLCEELLFNNGAYAEYIRVPARIAEQNTYEIPAGIGFQDAALIEPLACAIKGVDDSGAGPRRRVAVIGLGPLGMLLVKVAKLRGAQVIAVGRRKESTDRAVRMGADHGVFERPLEEVRALSSERGADIVIEAVGTPETWALAVEMVRPGGTVNFFGGPPSGTCVELDTNRLHYSEITCKASFHHTPEYVKKAVELVSARKITAQEFVTRERKLEDLPEVLAELARGGSELKTAILP